jgi:hypothetical protein
MMKSIFFYVTALTLLVTLVFSQSACTKLVGVRAKGDATTEIRNVSNFSGLDVATSGNVTVRVGTEWKVVVTCEENVIEFLKTRLDGDKLVICFDRPVYGDLNLNIEVTAPAWDFFEVTGSANVNVVDEITGSLLEIESTGSSEITFSQAIYLSTKAEVTGSGEITINGMSDKMEVEVTGSADIKAEDYALKTLDAEISGSGNLRTRVSDLLKARISGSGDIRYIGNPELDVDISGSGRVEQL